MFPRLRKPCISSNLWTPLQGRLTGVKLGQQIHREHDFHNLGARGDRVQMGFASNRTMLFWLILNTFLPTMGVRLIHAIGTFCQYFSPISGVRFIHTCDLYTGVYGTLNKRDFTQTSLEDQAKKRTSS